MSGTGITYRSQQFGARVIVSQELRRLTTSWTDARKYPHFLHGVRDTQLQTYRRTASVGRQVRASDTRILYQALESGCSLVRTLGRLRWRLDEGDVGSSRRFYVYQGPSYPPQFTPSGLSGGASRAPEATQRSESKRQCRLHPDLHPDFQLPRWYPFRPPLTSDDVLEEGA